MIFQNGFVSGIHPRNLQSLYSIRKLLFPSTLLFRSVNTQTTNIFISPCSSTPILEIVVTPIEFSHVPQIFLTSLKVCLNKISMLLSFILFFLLVYQKNFRMKKEHVDFRDILF